MPKTKKMSHHALPKSAPKRSGKRGVGPKLDTVDDFDKPVRSEAFAPHAEEKPKKPRQARLPEMEDAAIEALEVLAESYASIRDQRQELTTEEVRLKNELLDAMHKENKTSYVHSGVEIRVIVEKEKVRVRIKREEEAASAATA